MLNTVSHGINFTCTGSRGLVGLKAVNEEAIYLGATTVFGYEYGAPTATTKQ